MTIKTAAAKLEIAANMTIAARQAYSDMGALVAAEQSGFDRMGPLHNSWMAAQHAEDWASAQLVMAIAASQKVA